MSIKLEDVTYVYNKGLAHESVALDKICFEIRSGEFVGIIGHTGSGKSTLIQQLNGILNPDKGKIFVDEIDITDSKVSMQEIRKKVGLVFQYPEYQLFEETVAKDIAFGPLNLGLSQEESEDRVKDALEMVGLSYQELKERSPFELSGGQKRRVAIAGVVAMHPEILILDEPTAGLDPKAHDDILNMLKQIHERENNTIILVSHNMQDVAEIADRIIVMDHGKIALIGTPLEVYREGALIQEIGLELPPIMLFMEELRKRGIRIQDSVLTMKDAVSALKLILEKRNL